MDYEQGFMNTIRETVAACQRRGKQMASATANGQTYQGWLIDQEWKTSERGTPGGWYEERWERFDILLCPDGAVMRVGFWATDGTGGVTRERFESAQRVPLSRFVGTSGTPFSEWKAKLERLPYT